MNQPDPDAERASAPDAGLGAEPDSHAAQESEDLPEPEPDSDATLYSTRRAAPDDDATLLSTRGDIDGAVPPAALSGEATDDATVMARQPARGADTRRPDRSGKLPPDAPAVEVDRGHFGEQPSTYTPRRIPPAVVTEPPAPTPASGLNRPAAQIPEPARHREAQRHRRLILTAVIVAAGAAALTAAIVGLIALARGVS